MTEKPKKPTKETPAGKPTKKTAAKLVKKAVRSQPSEAGTQAFVYKVFKFFASLKLAITIIVSLMIIMAVGTIIESLHGADAARITVYESTWFSFVLLMLGMNVATVTIDRLPWKIKHVGFVITHMGILTILLGSFVTQQFMVDGQMVLTEGESDFRITLPEPLVYVFSEESGRDWIVPVKKKAFVWNGIEELADKTVTFPFNMELLSYYPKAYMEESIVAAEEGPPAIRVNIRSSFFDETLELIENDPELGKVNMGPAIFSFTDKLLKESSEEVPEAGYLEFSFPDESLRIPVEENVLLPRQYVLEDTEHVVLIEKIFKNAVVEGKDLIEQEKEGRTNPAVQFKIVTGKEQERHTAFSNFPDFPTMHGMRQSNTGARIFYRMPGGGSKGESHELRFVRKQPQDLEKDSNVGAHDHAPVQYQVQDGFKVTTHDLVLNEDISLGWMDLRFKVKEYWSSSKRSRAFEPASNTTQNKEATSALQIAIKGEGQEKKVWLGQGILEAFSWNGKNYHLLYGQKRMPVGFRLELKDFRLEKYPGTSRPASFESDVVLRDDARGILKETTISMNEPLEHQGFKIYQSGYQQEPGQPEVSIFSVGRDPGIPFKYAGTIIMVIGIVSMFFTRKFSTRAGKLG